ncbi:MAG TPA: GIY-YIG nuclease family protein [Anaerolineaceae bacterium]|nr:GIY-YIG nuclease family protein [Anaerolineaceae bacterium]
MPFFCYILECADGTFYTGWSTDPERRARVHNLGHGARYTRTRRPVRLVYVEQLPDHLTALRREKAIKALSRLRKEKLINECAAQDKAAKDSERLYNAGKGSSNPEQPGDSATN